MLIASTEIEDVTPGMPSTVFTHLSDITDRQVDEALNRLMRSKAKQPHEDVAAFSSSV